MIPSITLQETKKIIKKIIKNFTKLHYSELTFYWEKEWLRYIAEKNITGMTQELKEDMDLFSLEYIETFLTLVYMLKYKNKVLVKDDVGWTSKDLEYKHNESKLGEKKCKYGLHPFLYANKYGLIDLPNEHLQKIYGKDIIDGGAFDGNTAMLFSEMFQGSTIYGIEALRPIYDKFKNNISKYQIKNIKAINVGLGSKPDELMLHYSDDFDCGATFNNLESVNKEFGELVQVTTIDILAKEYFLDIGLIKLDIEGFEKKALEGAMLTIMQKKPIIIAAIYHNPVDFFEIKNFLKEINPSYKFMIRRSEMIIPLADIILIAY